MALPAEQTCPGTASGEQARRRAHPGALGLPARMSEGRDPSGQGVVRVPRSPPRALSAASSRGGAPRSALCRPQTRAAPRSSRPPRPPPPARASALHAGAGVGRAPALGPTPAVSPRSVLPPRQRHRHRRSRLGGGTPLRTQWNEPFPCPSLYPKTGAGPQTFGNILKFRTASDRLGPQTPLDVRPCGTGPGERPPPARLCRAPPRLWGGIHLGLGRDRTVEHSYLAARSAALTLLLTLFK